MRATARIDNAELPLTIAKCLAIVCVDPNGKAAEVGFQGLTRQWAMGCPARRARSGSRSDRSITAMTAANDVS
jgi:hypothetical protein